MLRMLRIQLLNAWDLFPEEDYPCVDSVGAPLKLQESFGLLENIDSKANLSVPNDCPKEKRKEVFVKSEAADDYNIKDLEAIEEGG